MAPLKIFFIAEAKMKRGNTLVIFPLQIIQLKLCPRLYSRSILFYCHLSSCFTDTLAILKHWSLLESKSVGVNNCTGYYSEKRDNIRLWIGLLNFILLFYSSYYCVRGFKVDSPNTVVHLRTSTVTCHPYIRPPSPACIS